MPFPGPGDSSDDDTDPELTYDLKGDERTETVQCDLNSGVLGLRTVSEAAAEDSQCGISTPLLCLTTRTTGTFLKRPHWTHLSVLRLRLLH